MTRNEPTSDLYLDDLHIGDVFRSDTYTLEEPALIEFAEQYDPQPFHTDPEAAKQTFFGGLAASGWHTAAITMKLLVTSGIPLADGIIGAGGDLAWPSPTRPGDTLRVTGTITGIKRSRSKPHRAFVSFEVETSNQNDEIVQRFCPNLIVEDRP